VKNFVIIPVKCVEKVYYTKHYGDIVKIKYCSLVSMMCKIITCHSMSLMSHEAAGTVGSTGVMKMNLEHMNHIANVIRAARAQHRDTDTSIVEKLDMLLARTQDIVLLMVMCPMYCSHTDMWWPVYEKMFLFLQLVESLLTTSYETDQVDVFLDVYNTMAKMCSAMMSGEII